MSDLNYLNPNQKALIAIALGIVVLKNRKSANNTESSEKTFIVDSNESVIFKTLEAISKNLPLNFIGKPTQGRFLFYHILI